MRLYNRAFGERGGTRVGWNPESSSETGGELGPDSVIDRRLLVLFTLRVSTHSNLWSKLVTTTTRDTSKAVLALNVSRR